MGIISSTATFLKKTSQESTNLLKQSS